jgi:hypothetical protein
MSWRKLGLLFSPAGRRPWMQTHASNAVALSLGGGLYRVYFSTRDGVGRAHVGYAEFDLRSPGEVLRVSEEPVLSPGPLGHFDDHGAHSSSIVASEGKLFLYYIGWNPGLRPPMFYASVGLAVSDDGGLSFRKVSPAPVLARGRFDPWMASAPFVLREADGCWRMWYISGLKWEEDAGDLRSFYHIKYAESEDGINWRREGRVCLDLLPGERNISRACVLKDGSVYRAWYGHDAGRGYRIGYAESPDGYVWERLDALAGIEVSESGWDSEALEYPYVFAHEGRKYMIYNGNGFGRDGFGLAVEDGGAA